MAVMIDTRRLKGKPSGAVPGPDLGVEVPKGSKVEVLGKLPPFFVEIKVPALSGQPAGWITKTGVDEAADAVQPLAGAAIANTVADHAEAFGVNAHFLCAHAHMRSGFRDGRMANGAETGPFGFSAAEWAWFSRRSDLGIELLPADIDKWRLQAAVSAARMMVTQNILAENLGRLVQADELALAVLIGPKTAAATLAAPEKPIREALAANAEENAAAAGVDRESFNLRFGEFLAGRTGRQALDAVGAKLQPSLTATLELFPQDDTAIEQADGPVETGSAANASVIIDITDTDLDALARVTQSEVAIFSMFGDAQLKGGAAAVVDTIFNRTAHKLFPNSIQRVIDQKFQFSAINDVGSWTRLPPAPDKMAGIVSSHVEARLAGEASIIKGAVNFLNPKSSDPGPLAEWGNFVVANNVGVFGDPDSQFVHFHGTAPGTGKPKDYALRRGGQAAHFNPDGALIGSGRLAAVIAGGAGGVIRDRIVELCLAEWKTFGEGTLEEAHNDVFKRVGDYWESIGIFGRTGQTVEDGKRPPWSAAFISFIVRNAGGGERFLYDGAHWRYVRDLIDGRTGALYEVVKPEDHAPEVGDLVHAGREEAKNFTFDDAMRQFERDKGYPSHSDFVIRVDLANRKIFTIGGNVSESVTESEYALKANGKLAKRGAANRPWIAVLRLLP
jgi:Uncharacterized protein conserved in bacteria (DUF2272)/Cell Wall Hydrolase